MGSHLVAAAIIIAAATGTGTIMVRLHTNVTPNTLRQANQANSSSGNWVQTQSS
jgi:hypothetical protein